MSTAARDRDSAGVVMDVAVGPGGAFTTRDLDRSFRQPQSLDLRTIDLRGTKFIDPTGLVATATLVADALDQGMEVEFLGPELRGPSAYMHRLGVGAILDEYGVEHDLEPVGRRDTGDRLLVLSRFAGDDSADLLSEQVHRIFSDDPDVAANLYCAVQEIAQNVLDHSEVPEGYMALQQYKTNGSQEVSFAIGDGGVGLRASLSKVRTVEDDREAIILAATAGVSSTGRSERGQGVRSVVNISDKRAGTVTLMAGDARGAFSAGFSAPRMRKMTVGFPGTLAAARLQVS